MKFSYELEQSVIFVQIKYEHAHISFNTSAVFAACLE